MEVALTPHLLEMARIVVDHTEAPPQLRKVWKECSCETGARATVSYEQVMLLSTFLRKHGHPLAYVHRLLRGTSVVELPPRKTEMTKERKEFLQKLRAQYKENQYKSMTQNIKMKQPMLVGSGISQDPGMVEMRQTLSAILSLVVTAASAFGFVFWITSGTDARRVLNGLLVTCVVVVAELYFIMRKTYLKAAERPPSREVL